MDHVQLGGTGTKISQLCLGTLKFGTEVEQSMASVLLDRFLDAGGNMVDTANVYGGGEAERVVGRWLRSRRRHDVVLASKVRFPTGPGPNDEGLGRRHLLRAVDESLRRLGTDHLDLLQVHCWDPLTPTDETWSTLDRLVQSGKVRHLGVSNHTGWQLQHVVDLTHHHGWSPVVSLQAQYSLLARSTEWELVEVCRREQLTLLAWGPLGGGWLTGQIQPGMRDAPPTTRIGQADDHAHEAWHRRDNAATWRVVEELLAVAELRGIEPAQLALAWILGRGGARAVPVVGVDDESQLESALAVPGIDLDEEARARLDAASEIDEPYPYDFVNRPDHQR